MKLLHGDCLELMKDIPSQSIDLILCDLPYGVTDAEWDSVIPFNLLWNQYNRIIKEKGIIVLFSIQPFTTKLINSNLKDFRYTWYWKKNNVSGGTYARYQPMRCIEDICVFYKKHGTYNPQGIIKLEKPKLSTPVITELYKFRGKPSLQQYTNYPKHILCFDNVPGNKKKHPTEKPVPLLEYLIKTYTNEGDTVLDNCMGSGSTGIACKNLNREFIGIEKEKRFFDIATERLNNTFC